MSLSSFVDSVVGFFSPEAGIRRVRARTVLSAMRSSTYAAAASSRLTGTWNGVDSTVNAIIGASSATVRARVRQLVRDFPYFARAVGIITDYVVGPGIVYQARVSDASGAIATSINTAIEDAWDRFSEKADSEGRLHLTEMMQLAKRQDLECGEFLIIRERPRGGYLPLSFRMIEPDWLGDMSVKGVKPTNRMIQGVEVDTATGHVDAYHIMDPDGWGKSKRLDASQVIHRFRTLRPGQVRGISEFTPGVLIARDLGDGIDATIDTFKLAAKYLAFVQTPDLGFRQAFVEKDDKGKQIEEIENAIIEYLRPGESINLASNPNPGEQFAPFVKLILSMLAVSTGVPLELLTGDYEGLNYSKSRTSRNDFAMRLRTIITRHIRHFCMPIQRDFLDALALSGKVSMPGYFQDPSRWQKAEWQPPGMESIDPLRETKARIDEINMGLRSPQEIARGRGRDLADIYREIQEAKALAEEMGLDFVKPSTSVANNPATILQDDESD